MRAGAQGWRSSRGFGTAGAVAGVAPSPPTARRRGSSVANATAPTAAPSGFPRIEERFFWPWQGVDFSFGYICFLLYFLIIISYIVNLGQAVMIGAILALTMGTKDRWKFPPAMFFMSAFMIVISLGYKATSYRVFVWAPLEDFAKVFLIMLVGVSVINTRARLRFFFFYALGVYAIFPVRGGVFNWFIYNAATQGRVAWNNLFENPNDYAALLIFPLGLCLVLFATERSKLIKRLTFMGLLSLPMIMFMTQSRGAILALGAGVFTYFVLQGKGRAKTLLAIGAISVVVVVFAPSSVWARLTSLKSATESGQLQSANDNHSAEQRFEIWKVAWSVHQAFPVTGVGWGAYPNAHSDFSRRSGVATLARGARDAHDTYLTVLGETGWIGFFIWSCMIAAIVMTSVRAMQRIRPYAPEYALQIKLVLLALLTYGVCGVFGSFQAMTFTYLHLATLLAMSNVANSEVDAFVHSGSRRRG